MPKRLEKRSQIGWKRCFPTVSAFLEKQSARVQRMSFQQKPVPKGFGPTGFNKFQITSLVRAVNFVTDQRMARCREVHPNLVHPPGAGRGAHQCETARRRGGFLNQREDFEAGLRAAACGMNALFKPDPGRMV